MTMVCRVGLILAPLVVAQALMAAPAQAAPVTIGSDLSNPADQNLNCNAPCTAALAELNAASAASPLSGVIVRWRIKAGQNVVQTAFRVVRPGEGGTFAGVGTSAAFVPTPNAVTTAPTQLSIQSGDLIGVDYQGDADYFHIVNGATRHLYIPQLADGGPADVPGVDPKRELMISADVEPDVDADGLGDETQDNDVVSACVGLTVTKLGTPGNDVILGTPGNDVIAAGAGDDLVRGLGGNDVLCGGPGDDKLKGGKGKDKIFGESGRDTLRGGGGQRDTCRGGPQRDTAKRCETVRSL